ncbi:tripartite tricarboxylate transporter substrate binding protein [Pusillimonas sp. T7-7]|uniref:Bug family tripartite tricarboxylate transporter substrate binding protein n=1 Tax=Pusillimonas sp. (strain T7-7) TaxID=1007105 RepID=UPI0002D620A7|nr:tripartite tricarboxylate transporter substrate binding protein [Pusillimonas sp. T7-7]
MFISKQIGRFMVAIGCASISATCAAYPDRPITAIVPFTPGGSVDPIARMVAEQMRTDLGADVIILNKPGAGGTLGTMDVARAKPDGYTIGFTTVGPLTSQPHLRAGLKYDADSFEYICRTHVTPQVFAVSTDSPYKSLKDLVEDAKRHPGKITMASTGVGSIPHLASIAFAKSAGFEWQHIPTKGDGDALVLAAAGEITGWVAGIQSFVPMAGRLRALGILEAERSPLLPDVPTFKEQGYDVESAGWGGLIAPKGTPVAILQQLSDTCGKAAHTRKFLEMLDSLKLPQGYLNSQDFKAYVNKESAIYKSIIAEEGITVDQ